MRPSAFRKSGIADDDVLVAYRRILKWGEDNSRKEIGVAKGGSGILLSRDADEDLLIRIFRQRDVTGRGVVIDDKLIGTYPKRDRPLRLVEVEACRVRGADKVLIAVEVNGVERSAAEGSVGPPPAMNSAPSV